MFRDIKIKMVILFYYFQTKYGRRFSDRSTLFQWQNKKIRKLINSLPKDNFYHTRLEQQSEYTHWQSWPFMDKSLMMEHFDTLNTVGIKKEEAYQRVIASEKERTILPQINGTTVGLSSGTSGHRGLFLVSPKERYAWVGSLLAKLLKKSILKPHKIALFLRANSELYETLNEGSISFCFFDMIKPIHEHSQQLNQFAPDILIAPASVLRQLSALQNQKTLTLHVQQIYSCAEVLDPIDKHFIEKAFNQSIGQIYQATEGFLGISCALGKLHLNEDLLHIEKEYLDKKRNKFTPIVTDFSRKSQPIIRYRLNDILTEDTEPCGCGSLNTVIRMIEGRCDDLITLPHVDNTPSNPRYVDIFPDFIRQVILLSADELEEYLVFHDEIGSLNIALCYKQDVLDVQKIQQSIRLGLAHMAAAHNAQISFICFIDYPTHNSTDLKKRKRITRTYEHVNASIYEEINP